MRCKLFDVTVKKDNLSRVCAWFSRKSHKSSPAKSRVPVSLEPAWFMCHPFWSPLSMCFPGSMPPNMRLAKCRMHTLLDHKMSRRRSNPAYATLYLLLGFLKETPCSNFHRESQTRLSRGTLGIGMPASRKPLTYSESKRRAFARTNSCEMRVLIEPLMSTNHW